MNTEIEDVIKSRAANETDYYYKSVAEKLSYQKKLMAKELNSYGIQTILTDPKSLTIDTINKYLEVKAKALI
jgi:hypothetical protein